MLLPSLTTYLTCLPQEADDASSAVLSDNWLRVIIKCDMNISERGWQWWGQQAAARHDKVEVQVRRIWCVDRPFCCRSSARGLRRRDPGQTKIYTDVYNRCRQPLARTAFRADRVSWHLAAPQRAYLPASIYPFSALQLPLDIRTLVMERHMAALVAYLYAAALVVNEVRRMCATK